MKKKIFLTIFVILIGTSAFPQQDSIDISSCCVKDTTMIKVEQIKEYIVMDKASKRRNQRVIVYIIYGRYADNTHRRYNKDIQIVSLDTITLQRQKSIDPFVMINGNRENHRIMVQHSYIFHLELSGCIPILGGCFPEYFRFKGVRIPTSICPLQPYRALELKGLEYVRVIE